MKTVILLTPTPIAGAVRYPSEGPQTVADEEADRLVEAGMVKIVEDEDGAEQVDALDPMKVAELKELAAQEDVDLGNATTKAEIIAAIRADRAGKES